MFSPQEALPLPARPNLDQYKKLAKDLVKAANSVPAQLLRSWIKDWIDSLVKRPELARKRQLAVHVAHWIGRLEEFAEREKSGGKLSLSKSQFVLARAHGFASWPVFSRHLEASARSNTAISCFERAADAVVDGDLKVLETLLRNHPELVRARSAREHRATLLHYTAANGVENYRQSTPQNVVAIAKLLLDAGAEVDATADAYGGGATTLNLAATSLHPEQAGVLPSLLELLLQHGANPNHRDSHGENTLHACLANGRPRAAEFLADHGAELDLESAAGLGHLKVVEKYFDAKGNLAAGGSRRQLDRGFLWAAEYGRDSVVEFLLNHGADLQEMANAGQTALHLAINGAHVETVKLLLAHGANLEVKNQYGGTALGQALWSAIHAGSEVDYLPVIEVLVDSGAKVPHNSLGWVEDQNEVPRELKRRIADVLTKRRQ